MKKLPRAGRAAIKAFRWIAKSLLTLLALTAMLLWPISRGRLLFIEAQRSSFRDGLDRLTMQAGSRDGRIFFARDRLSLRKDPDGSPTPQGGWIWRAGAQPMAASEEDGIPIWRPFESQVTEGEYERSSYEHRVVSAPFWLVAAVAIASPLSSIALLIRGRMKRRRHQSPTA